MKRNILVGLVTGMVILGIAGAASASIMVGPTSATTTAGESYSLDYSFDQSGLSANYTSGVTDFDSFTATTTHTSRPGTDYVSYGFGSVTYDLGQSYLIEDVAFWNFGGGFANPDFAVTAFDLHGDATFLGNYNPSLGGGLPDIFSFGPIWAQTFQIDIISSGGASGFGIGEVAFGASTPVPEPASMLLFGAGLAGLVGTRMRKKS